MKDVSAMRNTPSTLRRGPSRTRIGEREHLQALTRGLQALAQMNRVGITTNAALAKRIGLKYSTAHRILMVLADAGLVRHDALGHQFVVASGVRELSAGFCDTPFVDEVALPRMRGWTRRHGLPLLLVTDSGGMLTVRASTDAHWPVSGERHVAGRVLTARGSGEAAIFAAFGTPQAGTAAARALRKQGFSRRMLSRQGEVHVSVPVISTGGLIACLSIRSPIELMQQRGSVRRWATALRQLATEIGGAHA
jgi:DNA-binding IclR family transcriptional regulator